MFTRGSHSILRLMLGVFFTVSICAIAGSARLDSAASEKAPKKPAGEPEVIFLGQAHGLTLAASKLFINRSCGGEELYLAPSFANFRPTSNPDSVASLYIASELCSRTASGAGQVLSINLAADDVYAYWLTRNGNIVRNLHNTTPNPNPEVLRQMANPNPLSTPPAYSIAVNATKIVWNEGRQIYSMPKSIGGAYTLLGSATYGARKLYLTNQAPPRLIYLDGASLMSMALTASPTITPIATNVSDYYIDGVWIYYAQNSGSSYQLLSVNLNDHTIIRSPHYTSPLDPSLRATNLAASGDHLYWFERQGNFWGQIYTIGVSAGSRSAQTGSINNIVSMAADSTYIYWLSQATPGPGVYRLSPGASVIDVPGDMSITGITVTQGIQVGDNQIPLIGWKPTVVRVFVASTPGNHGAWKNVRARLDVEGSSVSHYAVMNELPSASSQRVLTETFNFALSEVETLEGMRHITATIFSLSGRREDNRANNTFSKPILFTAHREIRMPTLQYSNLNKAPECDTDHDDGYFTPWTNIISHTVDARDLLPLHLISIFPATGMGIPPIEDSDCLAYRRAIDQMIDWINRAYPSGGVFGLVMQPDSGHPGGSDSYLSTGNRVINIQDYYLNHVLAHEFGHGYRGVYLGNTHTWDAASHYPRSRGPGDTAEWMGDFIGLGTFGGTRLIIGSLDPSLPSHDVWDIMSYGRPRWASPYTYCKDLKYMSDEMVCCPDSVEGGCSSPDRPAYDLDGPKTAPAEVAEPSKPGVQLHPGRPQDSLPYLYVSGWISPTNEVDLNPFEIIDSAKKIATPSSGSTYSIKLLDSAANTLQKYEFDYQPQHLDNFDNPAPTPTPYPFSAYLPWDPNTVTIILEYKGLILAQRAVSKHAPLNVVQAFSPTEPVTGTYTLDWIASDEDSDPLTFSVWYSPDNGASWLPIAVSNSGPAQKLVIDFNLLPGSNDGEGMLRVLASDGVLTTESRTETAFTVAHKPPSLILTPVYGSDGFITSVQANAIDPEDMVLSDPTRFAWSSNWDGPLGDGLSFNTVRLSPGEHILSASVTDYDSLQASATITVNVPGNFESNGVMAQAGQLSHLYFDASLPMTLSVPPGAIKDPVRFRASLPLDTSFDPPGAIGPSFVISAALITGWQVHDFYTPLTLTVAYNHDVIPEYNERRAQIFTWNEEELSWDGLDTVVDSLYNRATAVLPHLSRFVFVIPNDILLYLPVLRK